jgi:hypothetical protein
VIVPDRNRLDIARFDVSGEEARVDLWRAHALSVLPDDGHGALEVVLWKRDVLKGEGGRRGVTARIRLRLYGR